MSEDHASPRLRVHDPRSAYPPVESLTLADRPADPAHARYCLIQTMPPGSGLEPLLDAVEEALRRRFPAASVERLLRRDFMIDDPAERAEVAMRSDAVLLFLGPAATMAHVGWVYGTALERAGVPVAVSLFQGLERAAAYAAQTRAAPLRSEVISATATAEERAAFARRMIDALLRPVAEHERGGGLVSPDTPARFVEGATEDLHKLFRARGWTDGLPIVLPTEAAVESMLVGVRRQPTDIVSATLRPEGLATTVEMVAINAVMAGAEPRHLPVILAAVSCFGEVEFESMTRSVNSFGFAFLVGGPIARELDIACATNALGVGNPSNAVIARAIFLTVRNCGRQQFDVTSSPAQGNATGFTVFAENIAESPWAPFHSDDGYGPEEDTVTVFTGMFTTAGSFYYRGLDAAADLMLQFDNHMGALLLMTPKRARALAAEGHDRDSIRDHLWRKASIPLGTIRASGFFPLMKAQIERAAGGGGRVPVWPADYLTRPDSDVAPAFPRENVRVAVVGNSVASVMQLWNAIPNGAIPVAPWR